MKKKATENLHLREFESVPFNSKPMTEEFRTFCEKRLLPELRITGYKTGQKREALMQAAKALICTRLVGKVVADSRTTANAATRQRTQLWDLLVEAGYCRKCPGSEQAKKVTRYRATKKLMGLRKFWRQNLLGTPVKKDPNSPLLGLVIFKPKEKGEPSTRPFEEVLRAHAVCDKSGKPDPMAVSTGIAVTRAVEEIINAINGENLNHAWKAQAENGSFFQPSVRLVQMHIRQLYRGVRLYTPDTLGGQNIEKEVRASMRIDGCRVAELDFSGSLPRLAYHKRKIAVDPGVDIYAPHKIAPEVWSEDPEVQNTVRNFVKTATIICFNVDRRTKALGAIRKEWRKHPQRGDWSFRKMPSPQKLVERIARHHQPVLADLFSDRGMTLVSIEGRIMFQILEELVLRWKRPALPIHDALIVRRQDAKLARKIMKSVYQKATGFPPKVKCKFH